MTCLWYVLSLCVGGGLSVGGLLGLVLGRGARVVGLSSLLIPSGPLAAYALTLLIPPQPAEAEAPLGDDSHIADGLERVIDVGARTDAGGTISLYRPGPPLPHESSAAWIAEGAADAERLLKDFAGRIRITVPAGIDYNCYGWVFTGGRFWIRPNAVPAILDENGYKPVAEPVPGDLIVYWDAHGWPLHCGLVRSGAKEGRVLVESKWGHGGQFVHSPEDQTYSTSFTFLRSRRQGHLLKGLEER